MHLDHLFFSNFDFCLDKKPKFEKSKIYDSGSLIYLGIRKLELGLSIQFLYHLICTGNFLEFNDDLYILFFVQNAVFNEPTDEMVVVKVVNHLNTLFIKFLNLNLKYILGLQKVHIGLYFYEKY